MNAAPQKLRILHVIPSISTVHGGPSRAIRLMEHALTQAGAIVTTITTDDNGPRSHLRAEDKGQYHAGARRVYVRKWIDFYKIAPGVIPWLWRNIDTFDVVHIHAMFSFTSAIAGLIARSRNIPYIIRPLGTLSTYGLSNRRPILKKLVLRFIDGPILEKAAAVHFTSDAECNDAKSLGIRFRGVVIPLGIPTVRASDANKVRSEAKGRRVVLYLSRLDPVKNVEGLIRAAAMINWRSHDAILVVAGDGHPHYVAKLKLLAKNIGVDSNVVWAGHIEGKSKEIMFECASIFVLPSFSESFGIAAVEALLYGLPCILSRTVGIAPQVRAAGAGLVVGPHQQDLADAITRLLDDPRKCDQLGQKGKQFAEKEYSVAVMGERLINIYRDVATSRRPK